jgi:hypothetical protein
MFEVLLYIVISIAVFRAGVWWGALSYQSLEWRTLKWNSDCMGYRFARNGTKIFKGDKAFLCIPVLTDHLQPGQSFLVSHDND